MMGELFLTILVSIFSFGLGLLAWKFIQESRRMRENISNLTETITRSLTDTRQSVQEDLKHSSLLISGLQGKLGELTESSRHIYDIGKDISSLQELFRSPKLRGGIGEYFLEDILSQILPRAFFDTQFSFRSGHVVDAVVRIGGRLVSIDSKFPLENFRLYHKDPDPAQSSRLRREFIRCVKKHIDSIAEKYILPSESTYDFALMYIPAENVYYDCIIKDDSDGDLSRPLFEYAIQKKVIPVSPNSIYAYLQVVVLGLRGFQIEGQTKEVLEKLLSLKTELGKVENEFGLVGKHLLNTSKTFDRAQNRLVSFGSKIHTLEEPSATIIKTKKEDSSVISQR